MNRQTAELVRALAAVTKHVPRVSTELLAGTMAADKQQEFAGLLIDLAGLLASHADDQAEPGTPVRLSDRLATTGRQLVAVATRLQVGALSGADLREVGRLLTALAEVVNLYADKLAAPDPPTSPEPPTS